MKNTTFMDILQKAIKYKFKNIDLLTEALSHPSLNHNLVNKAVKNVNYERLEFLGDTVLNLIISEAIFKLHPDYDEGRLAKLRASLVCKEQICIIAKSLNLANYIIMTEGEEKIGGRANENNLENTMEALIGAIYLDSKFEVVKKITYRLWNKFLTSPIENFNDPKSKLQEWAQAKGLAIPTYQLIEQKGSSHSPIFKIKLKVDKYEAIASGKSKKAAEKAAAKILLDLIPKI